MIIRAALLCLLSAPYAGALDRVALVVCNDPALRENAEHAAGAFEMAGFEVTKKSELNDFRRELETFASSCPSGGISAFYFAGGGGAYDWKRDRRIPQPDGSEKKEYYTVPASGIFTSKSRGYGLHDVAKIFRERSGARVHLFFFDCTTERPFLEPDISEWPSGMLWFSSAPGTSQRKAGTAPSLNFKSRTLGDLAAAAGGWPFITSGLMKLQSLEPRPAASGQTPPSNPKPGDAWVNPLGMTFCWCPPGVFLMGAGIAEDPQFRDSPQVDVSLSRGFWIQKYEFSRGDYYRARGRSAGDRDTAIPHANRPITGLKGPGALDMGPKTVEGALEKMKMPTSGWSYRLPTEAQWEYACRAGTSEAYHFGYSPEELGRYANFADAALLRDDDSYHYAFQGADDLTGAMPAPVGSYLPNAWGIHDMHGNVSEYTDDHYTPTLPGGKDPRVRFDKGNNLVVRGGAWCSTAESCLAGYRNFSQLSNNGGQSIWRGMRLVLVKSEP